MLQPHLPLSFGILWAELANGKGDCEALFIFIEQEQRGSVEVQAVWGGNAGQCQPQDVRFRPFAMMQHLREHGVEPV